MPYLLGIDNGGTMTKAAIFDQNGNEIAVSALDTPLITPREGWNERDMLSLWEATLSCIRAALSSAAIDPGAIAAVGCTGHGKGLYLWGKDGKPAYHAIASTDHRAQGIVDAWYESGVGQRAAALALQPVIDCLPVSLLAWMKKEHPEVLENTRYIFEAKDYIRFMLTGVARAEVTDYSGTCLMNLKTRAFDRELLELFGIGEVYEKLPPLCYSYELCGGVTEEVARRTGLAPGTPVCGGMFDIDACAVAMDVTAPNRLCAITGTWSINEYVSQTPVRYDTSTHNSLFAIPGMYLIEESSPTSAGNLGWFIDHFMKERKAAAKAAGGNFYDEVNRLVDSLAPEDSAVMFLPFLYGSSCEYPWAAFAGLCNNQDERHFLRAIYEGVVFCHLRHIEKLLAFRERPAAVRLAGGAANSRVWVQMFADALGIPVEVVKTKELGAQGCAMAAAVAAGIYRDYPDAARHMVRVEETALPDPRRTEIYREKYARFNRFMRAMEGVK